MFKKSSNFYFIVQAISLFIIGVVAFYFGFFHQEYQLVSDTLLFYFLLAIPLINSAVYFFVFIPKNNALIENQVNAKIKENDLVRMRMVESARVGALNVMASGVAHEINNPLAILLGHVEHIRRYLVKNKYGDERIFKCFKTVEKSAERITRITKSLRFIAHEGEKEEFQVVSVRALMNKILDLTLNRTAQLGIDLTVFYKEEDLIIECKESQIGHAILNLINNSIDALKEVEHAKWIQVVIDKGDFNEMTIRVTDSGFGITPEVREKMLEPFFTTKDVGEGAGLGLNIALGIVKDHQGKLQYLVKEEHTAFELMLPLQQRVLEGDVAA